MSERDPLIDHDDNNEDKDDDENTTRPFSDDDETPGPSGEQIEMTTINRGKEDPKTAETSFIDNKLENPQITLANLKLEQMYPEYRKNGRFLNLVVDEDRYIDKVVVVGPGGGKTPLFTSKGEINPKIPRHFESFRSKKTGAN